MSNSTESEALPDSCEMCGLCRESSPFSRLLDFLTDATNVTTFCYRSSDKSPYESRYTRQHWVDEFECERWKLW